MYREPTTLGAPGDPPCGYEQAVQDIASWHGWDFHEQFHFKPEVDVRWPPFIEELDRPEKMHIIAERLEQRGFSGSEVAQVMGGNFMRVYEEILG